MLKAIASSGGTRARCVSKGVYKHAFAGTPIGNFALNANGDTNAGVISFYDRSRGATPPSEGDLPADQPRRTGEAVGG